jgi:uncharacterized membrane protein
MFWLIIGLFLFHGLHSLRIVAPDWRNAKVASMGEGPWKGLYSIASIIAFVILVWGYTIARTEAGILYVPPDWGRHVAWLLMALAFIALAAYMLPPGNLKAALKHPMLVAIKLWAVAHLFANGDTASVLLFGSFLVWAVIDRISVKRRGEPGPQAGPLTYDIGAVVLGLGIYMLFLVWAHAWLFGVSPV